MVAAVLGGGAVVALGALTATSHQGPSVGGTDVSYLGNSGGAMTLVSEVTTTVDEPMQLATSKAAPVVTATFNGEH